MADAAIDDPAAALAQLQTALDGLEATLDPVLSKPWAETIEGTSSVERAKMDVLLAYSINNLVWMYLRTRGIKPEEHPVNDELARLQKYYAKVRDVESPKARPTVNTPAAARLVSASIPARQRRADASASASSSAAALARAQAIAATDDMMARRFRFVAEAGEKVLPGTGGVEDVVMGESDEARDEGDAAEAEALLADVDSAILAEGGEEGEVAAAPVKGKGGAAGGKKKNKKRKRPAA